VTLLVLLGILAVGAVYGAKSLFAPIATNDASPSPSCTATQVKKGQQVKAHEVQVSVFNAGTRSGLAGRTMSKLVKRGFRAGEVGNAPAGVHVKRAQVWTTHRHDPAAKLVARQLGAGIAVELKHTDLGPGVDVVLGNGFHGLAKPAKAPAAVVAQHRSSVCTPTKTSSSP
jgi:hypothetical protein